MFSTALIKQFLKSEKYPIKMKGEKLKKPLSSLHKKLLATEDTEAFGCLLKEAGTHNK